MKTASAKAKGRALQKWFVELLVKKLLLDEEDIESRPMGSQGEDIILGKQRHGPTGTIKVEFEGIYTKFKDLSKN